MRQSIGRWIGSAAASIAAGVLAFASAPVWAEAIPSEPEVLSFPLVYRLQPESSYTNRAVACDVPDVFSEALRGTLTLRRVSLSSADAADGVIARFAVTDVNLIVDAPREAERITGSGVYEIYASVGLLTVLGERLALNLSFGDEPNRLFDSNRIPADGHAKSFDLVVEEQKDVELPCTVRSLRIAADFTPLRELVPYTLGDSAAYTSQVSPTGPVLFFPASGSHVLTRLPAEPSTNTERREIEWAMVNVGWSWYDSRTSGPLPVETRVIGSGIYQQFVPSNSTGAFPTQRLVAQLTQIPRYPTLAPVASQAFDSGVVQGPAPSNTPPVLNLRITDTDPGFPIEGFNVVAGPRIWRNTDPVTMCSDSAYFELVTFVQSVESNATAADYNASGTADSLDMIELVGGISLNCD